MDALILERHVTDLHIPVIPVKARYHALFRLLLLPVADLAHPFQTNLHVLPTIKKLHELFHRSVQLPDNILYSQHHTQRQAPPDHSRSGNHRNHDILYLINQDTAGLLTLLQPHRFDVRPEQVRLYILPFPTAAALTMLELDLLHAVQHLHRLRLVSGPLLKIGIIQQPAFLQEKRHPYRI